MKLKGSIRGLTDLQDWGLGISYCMCRDYTRYFFS